MGKLAGDRLSHRRHLDDFCFAWEPAAACERQNICLGDASARSRPFLYGRQIHTIKGRQAFRQRRGVDMIERCAFGRYVNGRA